MKKWKGQERMAERGSAEAAMTGHALGMSDFFLFLLIKKIIKITLAKYLPLEIPIKDLA